MHVISRFVKELQDLSRQVLRSPLIVILKLLDSQLPGTPFERASPPADAVRDVNGSVVLTWALRTNG